jgi:hypothetical protein
MCYVDDRYAEDDNRIDGDDPCSVVDINIAFRTKTFRDQRCRLQCLFVGIPGKL